MIIRTNDKAPKAIARITHHEAYDFDERTGLWHYRISSEDEVANIITDAGRVRVHTYLYGAGGQRASLGGGLNYVALSNDATAPAAGDTVLAGEITNTVPTAGLQRAAGTVTLPTGSGTQTLIQKTFLYTGTPGPQGVQKTALFDLSSGGTMAHEIAFAPRTLFTNDTLQVSFSITLA